MDIVLLDFRGTGIIHDPLITLLYITIPSILYDFRVRILQYALGNKFICNNIMCIVYKRFCANSHRLTQYYSTHYFITKI